ncbi:restriction endonuclease subunit S [Nostoc sp.]|uniref:restriction endonuclease subunit S n=1 Tax=Nostoc sp. TaxID=1180 RepID=UPI002FFB5C1A
MTDWKTDILGNVPIKFIDGDRSSRYPKREEFVSEGIPFLNAESINENSVNLSKANLITEEKFLSIKKGRLQQGDLILTTRGNGVGQAAFFNQTSQDALINAQLLILRPDEAYIDPAFLYYSFTTPFFKSNLKNFVSGSAQPQLPIKSLRNIEFSYPPLITQRKIADILSSYDRLIDNNNRRIALLEESIHLLYKEWFVRSRFPGYESVKLVDGIPEGWNCINFSEALILQRGFDLPNKDRKPGDIPIYASTGINGFHDTPKVKAPGVVTGRSGSLGSVMYVQKDFWPLNTTLWVKEFKKVTPPFAYCLLSQMDLNSYQAGAAVPTLNRNVIHGVKILVPCEQLQSKFDNFANLILIQIEVLKKYNYNLRQARNLLLPRLMNGSIAV